MPRSGPILEVEPDPYREALYKAVPLFVSITHEMLVHLSPEHHREYKERLSQVSNSFELAHQCGNDVAARSCAANLATLSREMLKLL